MRKKQQPRNKFAFVPPPDGIDDMIIDAAMAQVEVARPEARTIRSYALSAEPIPIREIIDLEVIGEGRIGRLLSASTIEMALLSGQSGLILMADDGYASQAIDAFIELGESADPNMDLSDVVVDVVIALDGGHLAYVDGCLTRASGMSIEHASFFLLSTYAQRGSLPSWGALYDGVAARIAARGQDPSKILPPK